MRVILLTSVLLAAANGLNAEDWPQFRGPGGQGVSTEADLPAERVERIAQRSVEGRRPGHRLVFSGHRRRAGVADDGSRRSEQHVPASASL